MTMLARRRLLDLVSHIDSMTRLLPMQGRMRGFAVAAALAFAAALLQWAMRPWVGDRVPYLFFLPALTFAAATCGRRPALLVLAAGALNAMFWAVPAGSPRMAHREDQLALLAYVLLASLLVYRIGGQRLVSARAAQAEARLLLAQEDTGIGVFELDYQSGLAYVSASLCRLLGQPLTPGSMPLAQWLAQLDAAHVDDSQRALQARIDRGELRYEREQQVVLPDGGRRWLQHVVRIDVDAAGRLMRARGATMDITERKRVDDLLRATQAELRQQVHDLQRMHALSQELVACGDDLALPLQEVLESVVELHGARHGLLWLCGPAGTQAALAAQVGFGKAFDGGLAADGAGRRAIASRQRVVVRDAQAGDAAGIEVPALPPPAPSHAIRAVHSTPLLGTGGDVLGAISVMFLQPREPDERELRLCEICAATAAAAIQRAGARAAAAANAQRFAITLDSSAVPFNIMAPLRDDEGKVIDFVWRYVNPAAARAFGHGAKRLVGERIERVLPGSWDEPGLLERYAAVADGGEAADFEYHLQRAGQDRWFHVVASALHGEVAVWFADISERKRNEHALETADRRKDEFLATLAHELRNPLAPIRQASMIARLDSSSAAQKRWAHEVIERQVQRMALLLDDLLDVSRITHGTLALVRSRVSLAELVDAAVETARPHIEAKRHRLHIHLPAAAPMLQVDALRLSQVVDNLLTNAAKYTDAGGQIRLAARVDGGGLAITVADDGIGLKREHLEQVFEMFAQVPGALSHSQNGLGIGLALSRGIVMLHGGSIAAASDGPGLGSEFTVRLPRSCLADAGPEFDSAPSAADAA